MFSLTNIFLPVAIIFTVYTTTFGSWNVLHHLQSRLLGVNEFKENEIELK